MAELEGRKDGDVSLVYMYIYIYIYIYTYNTYICIYIYYKCIYICHICVCIYIYNQGANKESDCFPLLSTHLVYQVKKIKPTYWIMNEIGWSHLISAAGQP